MKHWCERTTTKPSFNFSVLWLLDNAFRSFIEVCSTNRNNNHPNDDRRMTSRVMQENSAMDCDNILFSSSMLKAIFAQNLECLCWTLARNATPLSFLNRAWPNCSVSICAEFDAVWLWLVVFDYVCLVKHVTTRTLNLRLAWYPGSLSPALLGSREHQASSSDYVRRHGSTVVDARGPSEDCDNRRRVLDAATAACEGLL